MSENSNEKMAEEIANKYVGSKQLDESLNNSLDNKLSRLIIKQACMAMGELKDKQFKRVLSALSDTGSARDYWNDDDIKSLDSDISKVVSDNFWKLV